MKLTFTHQGKVYSEADQDQEQLLFPFFLTEERNCTAHMLPHLKLTEHLEEEEPWS